MTAIHVCDLPWFARVANAVEPTMVVSTTTYENGTININDDIEFSMRNTCKQITHYILSRYMGKLTDEIGRRRPFRNIGNAIVDLKWRAKNIDRKSIEGQA
jgi:hypothetical protein